MNSTEDVRIARMIVHILDSSMQLPVLSEQEHPVDGDISEFIGAHLTRVMKDENLKSGWFKGECSGVRKLCEAVAKSNDEFRDATSEASKMLFDIMQKNASIPSGDLVFCLFNHGDAQYLGILKFNYKHSYIHYVDNSESGRVNSIIRQQTALPNENQKIEECAIICLNDLSIKLIEQKYEINGENTFYFSELFLDCDTQISASQKVKIFNKATDKFTKKYFAEDMAKPAEVKKAVAQCIDRTESIDVEDVAQSLFRNNPVMKREYIEKIQEAGLDERTIPVNENIVKRSFRTQKIKTDSGIEINLPVEFFGDSDKIEFITNPDGTISIVLKNIGRIIG